MDLFSGLESNETEPIFFIEPSCKPELTTVYLRGREACSIESAARANPDSDIFVLFMSPALLPSKKRKTTNKLIKNLLNYQNIYLRYLNFKSFIEPTILKDWYKSQRFQATKFLPKHMSDVLRIVLLQKYGGTFLDLDMMVTEQLDTLSRNYLAATNKYSIGNSILNFDLDIGAWFLNVCLIEIIRTYDPNNEILTSAIFQNVLAKMCPNVDIPELSGGICQGITIYPPHMFYPIASDEWCDYFNEAKAGYVLGKLRRAKAMHTWNSMTRNTEIVMNSNQPYALLSKLYCPKVAEVNVFDF